MHLYALWTAVDYACMRLCNLAKLVAHLGSVCPPKAPMMVVMSVRLPPLMARRRFFPLRIESVT